MTHMSNNRPCLTAVYNLSIIWWPTIQKTEYNDKIRIQLTCSQILFAFAVGQYFMWPIPLPFNFLGSHSWVHPAGIAEFRNNHCIDLSNSLPYILSCRYSRISGTMCVHNNGIEARTLSQYLYRLWIQMHVFWRKKRIQNINPCRKKICMHLLTSIYPNIRMAVGNPSAWESMTHSSTSCPTHNLQQTCYLLYIKIIAYYILFIFSHSICK